MRSRRTFLEEVYRLSEQGEQDRAVDVIFKHVNGLLNGGFLGSCNRILHEIDLNRIPLALMVSFLTITAPVAEKLYRRDQFYQRVKKIAGDESLLAGLK